MKKLIILFVILIVGSSINAKVLISNKTAKDIKIDGIVDNSWNKTKGIKVKDKVSGIIVELKSLYKSGYIYFLVKYPDKNLSDTHKTYVWDSKLDIYKKGLDREDTFVFKWIMTPGVKDFSLSSEQEYIADIWFWKACRTNKSGYADDKYHIYSLVNKSGRKPTVMKTKSGKTSYLQRIGDKGISAYKEILSFENKGKKIPRYASRTPQGSRADIMAKGRWLKGYWIIEFKRKLNTTYSDDIQFSLKNKYTFGISRYEIAGKKVDSKLSQPLYGSGEIGESITLKFN